MDQTTLKRYAVLLRVETVESHLVEVFAVGPEEARALAASLESLEEVDAASIMQGQDQDYPVLIPIRVMEMVEFDEAVDHNARLREFNEEHLRSMRGTHPQAKRPMSEEEIYAMDSWDDSLEE